MVSAETGDDLERGLALINADDGCGRQCLKELHGKMAKTTCADDNNEGAGNEQRKRLLDGVVRRKAGVGERCCFGRSHVAQWHEVAGGRYKEVLGHTAIDAEAGTAGRNIEAVVLHAFATVRTLTAPPRAVHRDGRTNLKAGGRKRAGPECFDPAGVLVAKSHRCFARAACRELHETDIAMAGPSTSDTNKHLTRARIGLSDLVERSGGVDLGRTADQLECLHVVPLVPRNMCLGSSAAPSSSHCAGHA